MTLFMYKSSVHTRVGPNQAVSGADLPDDVVMNLVPLTFHVTSVTRKTMSNVLVMIVLTFGVADSRIKS